MSTSPASAWLSAAVGFILSSMKLSSYELKFCLSSSSSDTETSEDTLCKNHYFRNISGDSGNPGFWKTRAKWTKKFEYDSRTKGNIVYVYSTNAVEKYSFVVVFHLKINNFLDKISSFSCFLLYNIHILAFVCTSSKSRKKKINNKKETNISSFNYL